VALQCGLVGRWLRISIVLGGYKFTHWGIDILGVDILGVHIYWVWSSVGCGHLLGVASQLGVADLLGVGLLLGVWLDWVSKSPTGC